MTTYPTAYRKDSRQYTTPETADKRYRGIQPRTPRPANDNSFPANDNYKQLLPPEVQQKMNARLAGELLRRGISRLAPKAIPGLNVISTIKDIVEFAPPVIEWLLQRDPDIVTPRPVMDFHTWDWPGKPVAYPGDKPGFMSWWTGPSGVYYRDDLADIPGSAASPSLTPAAEYGTVSIVGDEYSMIMPEVFAVPGAENPFFEITPGALRRVPTETAPQPLTRQEIITRAKQNAAQSSRGSETWVEPAPWIGSPPRFGFAPGTKPAPRPAPNPGNRPNDMVIVVTPPGVNPNTSPAPRTHASTKPNRKYEREKKGIVAQNMPIQKIFGSATEASDFVDSLWDALPKNRKSGYYKLHGKGGIPFWKWRHRVGMKTKIADLWRGYKDIDLSDAVWNLAVNQLEDALIGKLGKKAQEQAKGQLEQLGRPVGFGFGPGS